MKPCENKLNHESILNGVRDSKAKAADNCRYMRNFFFLFSILSSFCSFYRSIHQNENGFLWDCRKQKRKKKQTTFQHIFVHVYVSVLFSLGFLLASFLLFSFIFFSVARSDQIKKDNNKFNVTFFVVVVVGNVWCLFSHVLLVLPYQTSIFFFFKCVFCLFKHTRDKKPFVIYFGMEKNVRRFFK